MTPKERAAARLRLMLAAGQARLAKKNSPIRESPNFLEDTIRRQLVANEAILERYIASHGEITIDTPENVVALARVCAHDRGWLDDPKYRAWCDKQGIYGQMSTFAPSNEAAKSNRPTGSSPERMAELRVMAADAKRARVASRLTPEYMDRIEARSSAARHREIWRAVRRYDAEHAGPTVRPGFR